MTPTTSPVEKGPLTFDDVFSVLQARTRRRILTRVAEGSSLKCEELASEAITEQDDSDLYVALYHNHLPKLDQVGLIDWDRESDTIKGGPNYDEIAPLITFFQGFEGELPDEWP